VAARNTTRPHRRSSTPAPTRLALNRFVFRNSTPFFAIFLIFVVWAFWPSYFSRPLALPDFHFQAHGIAMTLWCGTLVAQAYLIRTGRRPLHRILGKTSYALVGLVVITTISLVHFRLQGIGRLSNLDLLFLSLVLNALVVFLLLFGLAIRHRHETALHARYMICTVFPFVTPVTDRLIASHFRSLATLVPAIDGSPVLPVAGFVLTDLLLVGLTVWDWRQQRRRDVFAIALAAVFLYHVSVLTFYRVPIWRSFGEWFVRVPLL
jgi:hypothetical protein